MSDIGTLKVRVGGTWIPVSGGSDEVWIGPDDPITTNPSVELWYDTDDSGDVDPVRQWNSSWGIVATDVRVTDGNFATGIVVTSLTFPAVAGRRYSVRYNASYCSSPVGLCIVRITVTGNNADFRITTTAGAQFTADVLFDDWRPGGGMQTAYVYAYPPSGNLTVGAGTIPARFTIEDVGPISTFVPPPDPNVPWIPLALTAPWVTYVLNDRAPNSYRKIGDEVQVRIAAQGGTNASAVATLPVGFRPLSTIDIIGRDNASSMMLCVWNILVDGRIFWYSGGGPGTPNALVTLYGSFWQS